MNYSNMEISSMSEVGFYNIDTGVKMFDLTPIDCTMESNHKTLKEVFEFGKSATFEFDNAEINQDVVDMLIGKNTPVKDFTIEYDTVIQKQNRVHKKHRINKKWTKRYGYKNVVETYSANIDYKEAFKTDTQDFNCKLNNVKLIRIDGKEVKNK